MGRKPKIDFFNTVQLPSYSLKFRRGVNGANPLMEISNETSVILSCHGDKRLVFIRTKDTKFSRAQSKERCSLVSSTDFGESKNNPRRATRTTVVTRFCTYDIVFIYSFLLQRETLIYLPFSSFIPFQLSRRQSVSSRTCLLACHPSGKILAINRCATSIL